MRAGGVAPRPQPSRFGGKRVEQDPDYEVGVLTCQLEVARLEAEDAPGASRDQERVSAGTEDEEAEELDFAGGEPDVRLLEELSKERLEQLELWPYVTLERAVHAALGRRALHDHDARQLGPSRSEQHELAQ